MIQTSVLRIIAALIDDAEALSRTIDARVALKSIDKRYPR